MGRKNGRTNPISSPKLRLGGGHEKMAERTQSSARLAPLIGALAVMLALCPASMTARAEDPELKPALVVRSIHPDRQAAAVIDLFQGSRAANPAEAMAAWRRATGRHDAIGKPLQAVAALFNPLMVPELRPLHGAEFGLISTGGAPGFRWGLIVPNDDDLVTALITSLRLSGGADEPTILDPPVAVERLGEPGAAMAARLPGALVFASAPDVLAAEVERLRAGEINPNAPSPLFGPDDSGFAIALYPDRVAGNDRMAPGLSRFATLARGLGLTAAHGRLGVDGDRLSLALVSQFKREGEGGDSVEASPAVDPSWLAWFPERQTAATAAVALGRGAAFWDGLFQVADAIDRADPARADLAPLRTRLNFLGMARGVRLEADLWPRLQGASFGVLIDDGASPELAGAVVALHAVDAESARRILDRVVSPLASLAGAGAAGPVDDGADAPRALGRVSGRPLEALAKDATVLIGWGEGALDRALKSAESPDESLAAFLKNESDELDDRPINRFGAVWPDRTVMMFEALEPNSPLAAAMTGAAPVVWRGGWDGAEAWDALQWSQLPGVVARFLERIPQKPFDAP